MKHILEWVSKAIDIFSVMFDEIWILILMGGVSYLIAGIIVMLPCELIDSLFKYPISKKTKNRIHVFATGGITVFFAYKYYINNYPTFAFPIVIILLFFFGILFLSREEHPPIRTETSKPISQVSKVPYSVNAAASNKQRNTPKSVYSSLANPQVKDSKIIPISVPTPENSYFEPVRNCSEYKYETKKGDYVGSLGEQIIADKLFRAGIDYEYEQPLIFTNALTRPSFTITRKNNHKRIYWEYLTSTESDSENNNILIKKEIYKQHNIIEGINLFITTEKSLSEIEYKISLIQSTKVKQKESHLPKTSPTTIQHGTRTEKRISSSAAVKQPFAIHKLNHNSTHSTPYVYKTLKGECVRSHGEQTIANMLYRAGITYEYERLIMLGNQSCRPDFSIPFPPNGEMIYWEHCGMMDDADYRAKWKIKKETYKQHNIVESKNLIITTKTDPAQLNRIIAYLSAKQTAKKDMLQNDNLH